MRLSVLLLLVWNAVALDCRGGPELVEAYLVRAQHVRLLGWTLEDPPNPIYSERGPQQGATSLTEASLSGEALLPGDVAWWYLDAVDEAGNVSNGGCT